MADTINTHNLKVPIDFGDIIYDDTNYFYPYKALAYNGNEPSIDIGNYDSFSKALLALISVNTIGKKNRARSLTSPEIAAEIDYLYYKTLESTNSTDNLNLTRNFPINNHQGPLRIVLGGSENHKQNFDNAQHTSSKYNHGNCIENTNPLLNLTFREVYERWYNDKSVEDVSNHTMNSYRNIYNKVRHLDNIPFVQIRYSQIYDCIIQEKLKGNSFSMRKRVKLFFSQLYQWAIVHEMCTNNIALNIKLGKNESDFKRKLFSIEQIQKLIKVADQISFAGEVAMLILCGCRISEFLNIKRQDIHIDKRYFIVSDAKTKVGRNRIVPIHKKVMKFWRSHLRAKSDYLIHDARGRQMKYEVWASKFRKLMKYLQWNGMSIHGCRHTCVTLLHTFGADPYDSRAICGHTQPDVESRVYLHIQAQSLVKAIDLIKI